MTTTLDVTVVAKDGSSAARKLTVRRSYNLGSATRDAGEAVHHQEEVAKSGVRIAFDIPAPRIYPIAPWALTTEDAVGVLGPRTSGEVEIVIVVDEDGEVLVGVGSDHTDRDLERMSILWSKQSCPNVLAPVLWRWADVKDHWDSCELWCDLDGEPYQRCGVAIFRDPEELIALVRERAEVPEAGFMIFCGTYVSVTGSLAFGERWTFGLVDPILDRRIEHSYTVDLLLAEVNDGFRVPLRVTEA
jgi:2-keto-4-pentenoate hydratase/2-oxohepta-3-ene-1,7-dioic acid hydratase in catechol pathway